MSKVSRAALILVIFFGIDKGLAIIRQVLTARVFGLSAELDAFNAANNLPDLLFALISGGALAIAFIPVLTEVLTRQGKPEAWKLFSRIANLAFIVTAILAVITAFLSEQLVGWKLGIAPGFNADQQHLVAELMRLNLIATLIFSISGLVMAGLQANQHFLTPAIAPLLYNAGQIFGALILAPEKGLAFGPITLPAFGLGVHGLVYGVIIGAGLHLGIQIPALVRYQFQWTFSLGLATQDVRKVLRLLGPRLLTMLFIQLIFIVRDNLASGLDTGAVSALTYGWMLMQVPETLIGTTLGTALLPTLAEHAARADWTAFKASFSKAFLSILSLTVPVAVILSLGLSPLVQLAFGFDSVGTALVMAATQAYLAGLFAHALIEICARAFYSKQDARIPLLASAITGLAFIAAGVAFRSWLGAAGIALATSVAFTVELVFLYILLSRQMKITLPWRGPLMRILISILVGGGITYGLMLVLPLSAWISSIIAMGLGFLASLAVVFKEIREVVRI